MTFGYLNAFGILKTTTLALLAVLLFSLGSVHRPTSLGAYLSFSAIMLLQGIEMLAPSLCFLLVQKQIFEAQQNTPFGMRPSTLESWMRWLPVTTCSPSCHLCSTGHARTVALGEACDSRE
jgi:hypothetical protein